MDKKPFSAPDPDRAAYDAMIAKDKRLRAERDAKLYGDLSDTAATGGTVAALGEAALGARDHAAARAGKRVAKTALKSAGKVTPIIGNVLDGLDAAGGVAADLKRGIPPREALLRNGVRVAPGLGGAIIGEVVGGPLGGAVGGIVGGLVQPYLDVVLPPLKEQMERNFNSLNDPRRWPTRRLPF